MAKTKRMQRTLRRAGAPNIGYYTWSSGKKVRKFAKCYLHLCKLRNYYFEHDLPIPAWTFNEPIRVQRKALSYYLSAYPQISKSVEIEVKKWDESLFGEIEAIHETTEQICDDITEIIRKGETNANQF